MAGPTSRRRFLELAGLGGAGILWGCGTPPGAPRPDEPADLITRQETPFNAEPALSRLTESWITPIRHFYVRRHGNAPLVRADDYALRVSGLVERPLRIGLRELRDTFTAGTVTATLQCAGNRREEHGRKKKVGGVQWGAGALGNARWSGTSLADVLKKAGVLPSARHVCFHSLDECAIPGGTSAFGASIPISKALAPETLLAYDMNGSALTTEHGFPLRSLVPGFLGARSVKWLGEIRVTDRPSENFFQARDYKMFPPDVTAETARWDEAPALEGMPTNSAICFPTADQAVQAGRVPVRGYAVAATGRSLARVQVSADGGLTWEEARLLGDALPFAWRHWEAAPNLRRGSAVLAVRAWDTSGAVQPEEPPWNFKGYYFNGWHRVPVRVV